MRITGWLKTGFPVLGTRRGLVLSTAVYSFFAVSFLTAFLMPEGTVQRSMKLLGNYWLGVLLYMIFVIENFAIRKCEGLRDVFAQL